MTDPVSRSMTLNEFFESIPIGDIDQDCRNAPCAAGLYLIVNTVSWKAYIGQSQRIASRFLSHRCALRRNNHSNRRLQDDWNKYGEAIFRFCVFEIMDASLLCQSETQLISSSLGSCYNYREDLSNKPKVIKTSLILERAVLGKLKELAFEERKTVTELMAELVRARLAVGPK